MEKFLLGVFVSMALSFWITLIWCHFDEAHQGLILPAIASLYACAILGIVIYLSRNRF